MSLLISKYTYFFVSTKNKYLAYNSCSNSFLELSKDLFDYLVQCKTNPELIEGISDEVLKMLTANLIIVNIDSDEKFIQELKFNTHMITYSQNNIGLTIAPTNECNFRCPYCFEENKKSVTMTDKTVDDLIAFVASHKNAKTMGITWYGGEPLLAFDRIKKILEKLKSLPVELTYHGIVTNGYYFTDEVIDFFNENHLDHIQITFDGSKERHNKLRRDKDTRQGSYDLILANADRILERMPKTFLSVRVNIDKTNSDDYIETAKYLKERWKNYKNFEVYPGILRIDNEDRTDLGGNAMKHDDIADFLFGLANESKVYYDNYYPIYSSKVCSATNINAYIIGAEGEIYKCWNDLTDINKIVGYIDKKEFTNPWVYYDYVVSCKWHEDDKCVKCFFLPVCHGGCAWYKLRNLRQNGKYNLCQVFNDEESLQKCLEIYYDRKIEQKNNQI
ncbi:MAG: radical SAM protein [Prevotellaceae bacterium]|jgi:uncharacterized protein|nr:radical SAM protein [Prevotellaceae bacterium]